MPLQYISILLSLCSFLFGGGVLVKVLGTLKEQKKEQDKKTEALMFGMQASLRDRLVQQYSHYKKLGYMPYDEKESWLNSYKAYHSLGANGVMDSIHDEVLKMPLERN